MGRMPVPARVSALAQMGCPTRAACRITRRFHRLYGWQGWVAYAFRTRPPLSSPPKGEIPLDLHVLGLPPAFVLSQDQTLRCTIDFTLFFFSVLGSASPLGPFPAAANALTGSAAAAVLASSFQRTPLPLLSPRLSPGKAGAKVLLFPLPATSLPHFFSKYITTPCMSVRKNLFKNKKKRFISPYII